MNQELGALITGDPEIAADFIGNMPGHVAAIRFEKNGIIALHTEHTKEAGKGLVCFKDRYWQGEKPFTITFGREDAKKVVFNYPGISELLDPKVREKIVLAIDTITTETDRPIGILVPGNEKYLTELSLGSKMVSGKKIKTLSLMSPGGNVPEYKHVASQLGGILTSTSGNYSGRKEINRGFGTINERGEIVPRANGSGHCRMAALTAQMSDESDLCILVPTRFFEEVVPSTAVVLVTENKDAYFVRGNGSLPNNIVEKYFEQVGLPINGRKVDDYVEIGPYNYEGYNNWKLWAANIALIGLTSANPEGYRTTPRFSSALRGWCLPTPIIDNAL